MHDSKFNLISIKLKILNLKTEKNFKQFNCFNLIKINQLHFINQIILIFNLKSHLH